MINPLILFVNSNYFCTPPTFVFNFPEPTILKKLEEIRLGSKLSLDLFYGLSFRIQVASYFPQSLSSKNRFNILFSGFSWQELEYSKVVFIFIGPNSPSRAEDLAAVNHMTQAVVRVGSKIWSKSRVKGITARAEVFKSRALKQYIFEEEIFT